MECARGPINVPFRMPFDDDPPHDATLAHPPSPGTAPTLAQPATTGIAELLAGDDTLASSDPAPHEGAGASQRLSLRDYELGALLGRGGMGDVTLGRDKTIGRDVAIKQLRVENPTPEATARFLREARIQARLEHPSIVPVHHLGHDEQGLPYFTMKRLTGTTLLELLASASPPPRQRLLRMFTDVCLAVEFAHARGVVHRDLKPSNVMIGDFGEVYVLDWGLARIVADRETSSSMSISIGAGVSSIDGMTQAGEMLGTPGYMAPEQIEDASGAGAAADVYGLGSILFEILAGEGLHPKGHGALVSTLKGVEDGPRQRRPERQIAPELDALCIAALATNPDHRPTIKALAERLQRYLDGDRDVERRRMLAATHVERARVAYASGDTTRRAEAMQAAGHALVLDPESTGAAEIVRGLMFAPPGGERSSLPAELDRELAAAELAVQRRQGKAAVFALSAVLAYVIAAASNGVANVPLVLGIAGFIVCLASFAWIKTQRPARPRDMLLIATGNAVLVALLSRTYGSMLIVPAITCVMALSLTSYPLLIGRVRSVILLLVASWVTPVVLEQAGVLAPTWGIGDGFLTATSHLLTVSPTHTTTILIVFNIATIVVIGLFASALATSRRDAQRQLEIQAWHLRQLLPTTRGLTMG